MTEKVFTGLVKVLSAKLCLRRSKEAWRNKSKRGRPEPSVPETLTDMAMLELVLSPSVAQVPDLPRRAGTEENTDVSHLPLSSRGGVRRGALRCVLGKLSEAHCHIEGGGGQGIDTWAESMQNVFLIL